VAVSDTGIGIAEDQQAVQGVRPVGLPGSSKQEGTGLDSTLTKRLSNCTAAVSRSRARPAPVDGHVPAAQPTRLVCPNPPDSEAHLGGDIRQRLTVEFELRGGDVLFQLRHRWRQ
jgi:hypothetical protein